MVNNVQPDNSPENKELKDSIEGLKELQDVHDKILEEVDDVVKGETTKEEEAAEPENLLFKQIYELAIRVLSDPSIDESFSIVADNLTKCFEDPETDKPAAVKTATSAIVNIVAMSLVSSAYNSILFYDGLLKKELDAQFDHMAHHVNMSKADIEGLKALTAIFRRQISDINKKLQIDDINDQIGNEPPPVPQQ